MLQSGTQLSLTIDEALMETGYLIVQFGLFALVLGLIYPAVK